MNIASKTPDKMNCVEIGKDGTAEGLYIGKRPIPHLRPYDVLVKVKAAGVNAPDILQRKGLYPAPKNASDILGLEVSGTVIALGEKAHQWKIGDKICALANGGGYAEYVALHEDHCLPVPKTVSLIDAAGLPETFFTVWSNLFMGKGEQKGKKLLVHGGAGGIGSTAIQLGHVFGLEVFTTVSTQRKASFCKSLGAKETILYPEEDFVEIIRQNGGADIILDIIGGDYIARNFKAAKAGGTIIQLAFNKGSKVEINLMPLMLKRLTLTGSTLRSRDDDYKALIAQELRQKVWPLFETGRLKAVTNTLFSIHQAAKAHQTIEKSEHVGKILLGLGSINKE